MLIRQEAVYFFVLIKEFFAQNLIKIICLISRFFYQINQQKNKPKVIFYYPVTQFTQLSQTKNKKSHFCVLTLSRKCFCH